MSKHKTSGTKRAFATGCLFGWIAAWLLAYPILRYFMMAWREPMAATEGYIVGYRDHMAGVEITDERSKDALKLFKELVASHKK